ncbi:hypothetical protein [Stutzerimonas nitrititolerans]|uniref:hypothetical protein n=1 Tax=Stutzerimonas nitrititolerans TaxID=2482751 RepID=UPI0015E3E89B|nr:hypothetical protein [Stutzerimonas nitrititolerans]MBA1183970.1 hypothetical protein [Stutzerimonas stutzeri]
MRLPEPYRRHKFELLLKIVFSEENRKAYYVLCLLFGLLIFFLYFSHIGYVPRISLTDSAVLLFSAIFVGVGFTACLAGLFILPTVVWRDFLGAYLDRSDRRKAAWYLLLHQSGLLAVVLALTIYAIMQSETFAYALIGMVACCMWWLVLLLLKGNRKEFWCNFVAGLINFVVMAFCAVMLFYIAQHGTEDIKNAGEKEYLTLAYFFGGMTLVLFFNTLATSIENLKPLHVLAGSILLLLCLLLATRSWVAIPKGVMHTLGLGSFRAHELLISGESCAYFKGQPQYEAVGDSESLCKLKKPWVLWNGEETTLIRYGDLKYLLPREQAKLLVFPVTAHQ